MKKGNVLRLLAGAAILCSAGFLEAATVKGQLLNASNNSPAPYVAVRLNSQSRGASEFAYSGGDGRYFINNVPAGDYVLEVWRGGRMVSSMPIKVQEPVFVVELIRIS